MKKWYYNLKIGRKLIIGFLIIAMLATSVGIVGIINIYNIGKSYRLTFTDVVITLEAMERVSSSLERSRGALLEVALAVDQADKERAANVEAENKAIVDENMKIYKSTLEKYDSAIIEEDLRLIAEIEKAIEAYSAGTKKYIEIAMNAARRSEAYRMMSNGGEMDVLANNLREAVLNAVNYQHDYAEYQISVNNRLVQSSALIMIAILVLAVIIAITLGLFISRNIQTRISNVVKVADKLSVGDMDFTINDDSKDEIGLLSGTFKRMSETIKAIIEDVSYGLERMAEGDFTVDSKVPELFVGVYSKLSESMYKMILRLTDTLQQINIAADQVSTGSSQVSSGAQALAAGSTEQAASIQELSASIEKIAEQIAESSSIVYASAQSVQQAGVDTREGNEHMEQLSRAMEEIGQASNQIANITKVIEDIAFQTNILALNAAIEAARAGNAGKGFAVVADEVRALAAKSGEAAKQTAELINASVEAVAKGTEITEQTAQILRNIGDSANSVVENFEQIKNYSAEQAIAIDQIKDGVAQIAAVVQTNAANAEENSATSEEMSAQASTLRSEVDRFKLRNL